MGEIRDFLRGVGIVSSAGITISNAGTRLLNLRNDLNRLASKGASANEKPITEERLVGYGRGAVAAAGRHPARAAAGSESALERKRRLARVSMRRLRAKRKAAKRRARKR